MTNRYVPFISGLAALAVTVWLILGFEGWWRHLFGGFLFVYGWISLKTAMFATDTEIFELTTPGPISKKTEERLKNRL